MKILDQYILRKFLSTFLFILILFTVIITLIDFTEKNGAFIKYQLSAGEIMDYYSAYMLFVVNFITPITAFITTVFVTSRLAQRTEIIAMLSSGFSFSRLLVPYLAGALMIAAGSFYLTGWGLAKANMKRIAFESDYNIGNFFYSRSPYLHIRINPEQYLHVERYRAYNNSGTNVTIETIKDHQLQEKLSAKRIIWLEKTEKWRLQNWRRRALKENQEYIRQGATLDISLNLHPKDFSINPKLHETLTLSELNTHIESLKNKGTDNVHIFLTEKYVRYMTPFSAIILTFMGVIVAARKSRRGAGLQLAVGFMLACVYIACFLFAKGIAEAKGTQLLLTVWTPNIIFTIVSITLYKLLPQ